MGRTTLMIGEVMVRQTLREWWCYQQAPDGCWEFIAASNWPTREEATRFATLYNRSTKRLSSGYGRKSRQAADAAWLRSRNLEV